MARAADDRKGCTTCFLISKLVTSKLSHLFNYDKLPIPLWRREWGINFTSVPCHIRAAKIRFLVPKYIHVCVYLCQNVRSLPSILELKQRVASGCSSLCVPTTDYRVCRQTERGSQDSPKCDKFITESWWLVSCIWKHMFIYHSICCYFCMWLDWICDSTCVTMLYVCLSHVKQLWSWFGCSLWTFFSLRVSLETKVISVC